MFHQASTHRLFFSCIDFFDNDPYDFVGMLDLTAASLSLTTFYTTTYSTDIAGIAVSSTHLYFATVTFRGAASQILSVPLPSAGAASIPNGTAATAIYNTTNADLDTLVPGDTAYPTALQLNAAESILYFTDQGDPRGREDWESLYSVYALSPCTPRLHPLI